MDDGLFRRGCRGVSSVITVTVEAKEKGHLCRQDRSAPTMQVTGIQSAFEPRLFRQSTISSRSDGVAYVL